MPKASKKAQKEKFFLKPFQGILDKYKIFIDKSENFCNLIKSHSKKEKSVILHKTLSKNDFKELFDYISANYKDKYPMVNRDMVRCSYLDKDAILDAIAAENPNIMKELAKNFHNFAFYWKLDNPEELIEKWNQTVDAIQKRIQSSNFSINDTVEVIDNDEYDRNDDEYDNNDDEYIFFEDSYLFW